jgi:hypothetical protein
MIEDIEMRESQLVFVEFQRRWDAEENRTYALMRQLEDAENRLIAEFMDEWRDRGGDFRLMTLAYSDFRRSLLRAVGKPGSRRCVRGVHWSTDVY